MIRRQRIIHEVKMAIKGNALGAGRTTALEKISAKYGLAKDLSDLRVMCFHNKDCQFWV